MLEVYNSDVFALRIEHSKKVLTIKNQLCDYTLPDYDIFIRAIFPWSTCYGRHCQFLVVVWWFACHTATWRAMPALAAGRGNHAGQVKGWSTD